MAAAGNMDHRISTKRNGRFNHRLGAHLARMPQSRTAHHRRLLDHPEKEAYLLIFS